MKAARPTLTLLALLAVIVEPPRLRLPPQKHHLPDLGLLDLRQRLQKVLAHRVLQRVLHARHLPQRLGHVLERVAKGRVAERRAVPRHALAERALRLRVGRATRALAAHLAQVGGEGELGAARRVRLQECVGVELHLSDGTLQTLVSHISLFF